MHSIAYTYDIHQALLKWYDSECTQDEGFGSELYRTLGISIDYVSNEVIFKSESDFIMFAMKYA